MPTHTEIQPQITKKTGELESIRGLAALLIVLFHTPIWNQIFNLEIIRNGYLMVELFFVLSGFVIYNAYSEKINESKDLIRFQFLRFGRLYPVHLLFLLVFVSIDTVKYIALQKYGLASFNTPAFHDNNLTAFLQQLFLIQAIGPTGNAITFNAPAWSISVEFFTYIIFGLVVLLLPRFKIQAFALIFIASVTLSESGHANEFNEIIKCTTGFFLGCLAAYSKKKSSLTLPAYTPLIAITLLLSYLMFKPSHEYDVAIYFLTAFLIFSLVSSKHNLVNTFLSLKTLTWLGTISYSLYMSHFAVLWVINQTIRFVLKKPEAIVDGHSTPQMSAPEAALGFLLVIVISLIVSSIVYKYIENPLREKSRNFAFRKLK
jgi:peptidoglycan/LPS O-acetylase OafA/YrhL